MNLKESFVMIPKSSLLPEQKGYLVSSNDAPNPVQAERQAEKPVEKADRKIEAPREMKSLSTALTRGSGGAVSSSLPPKLKQFPPKLFRIRNVCVTAITSSSSVTNRDVLAMAGAMAVSATSAYSIHDIMKLKSVTVWPSAGTSSATGDFSISWTLPAVTFGNPDYIEDTTTPYGVTVTGPRRYLPPKNSICGQWLTNTNSQELFFVMGLTAGSIIDIEVWMTQSVQGGGSGNTSAGMSTGLIYYGSLFGDNTCRPVSGVPRLY